MPTETEYRYLVDESIWQRPVAKETIWQFYLSLDPYRIIRIRLVAEVGLKFYKAFFTIKGKKVKASCPEFEYPIPVDHAGELMAMRLSLIVKKTRYTQKIADHLWYVDVFHAENQGLILAEIENEEKSFELPPWIGEEVTEDSRYSNANLSQRPYSKW